MRSKTKYSNETFCVNSNLRASLQKWESRKKTPDLESWCFTSKVCRFRESRLVENEMEDNLNFPSLIGFLYGCEIEFSPLGNFLFFSPILGTKIQMLSLLYSTQGILSCVKIYCFRILTKRRKLDQFYDLTLFLLSFCQSNFKNFGVQNTVFENHYKKSHLLSQ